MGAPTAVRDEGDERRGGLPPSMVERMTLILDSFDGRCDRLTLEDIARRTELPRSTTHRIVDQLVRLSWLERTSAGYALGQRPLGFTDHGGSYADLREVTAPLLHELHMKTGLVVHLAILDGANVYYLDKVGGRFAGRVPSRVGGRIPAHSTALGKAMLAWLEPEEVESRLGGAVGRLTGQTIGDFSTLHRELNRIRRRNGLTFEYEECSPGIDCVAAPVRGPDSPLGSISLVGNTRTQLEKVAPLVVDATRRASRALSPEHDFAETTGQQDAGTAESFSTEAMDRLLATAQHGAWI